MSSLSWIPYAALLVVFSGVRGNFSSLPASENGFPDEMIYILWSVTMLILTFFILRSEGTFDRRRLPFRTWRRYSTTFEINSS